MTATRSAGASSFTRACAASFALAIAAPAMLPLVSMTSVRSSGSSCDDASSALTTGNRDPFAVISRSSAASTEMPSGESSSTLSTRRACGYVPSETDAMFARSVDSCANAVTAPAASRKTAGKTANRNIITSLFDAASALRKRSWTAPVLSVKFGYPTSWQPYGPVAESCHLAVVRSARWSR